MRKRLIRTFLIAFWLLLALHLAGYAQPSNPSVRYVSVAPSGACSASPPVQVVISTGVMYTCNNGTWGSAGGGGGTPASPAGSEQFNNGGSFGGETTLYIPPSGDATGVTDNAAIQAAIMAHSPVKLGAGSYYITGLTWAAPSDLYCSSNASTNISMVSSTNNLLTVQYGGSQLNTEGQGMTIRGCNFFYKGGVTPTAGDLLNISGVDGTHSASGFHFENNTAWGMWGGIRTGNYLINNWFTNNLFVGFLSGGDGGIYYNTPSPYGDNYFDGDQLTGSAFTGVTINAADTTEFSNIKINNGAKILFTGAGGGAVVRVRFVNASIEGANVALSCGIDFGTGAAPQQFQFLGGGIGLYPLAFCHAPADWTTSDMLIATNLYTTDFTGPWYSSSQVLGETTWGVPGTGAYSTIASFSGLYPAWEFFTSAGTLTNDILVAPGTASMYIEYSGTPASLSGSLYIRNKSGSNPVAQYDPDGLYYHSKTWTVGTLPSCAAGTQDAMTVVTDAVAFTSGTAPTGSGTFHVPVYCQNHNGSYAWIMY